MFHLAVESIKYFQQVLIFFETGIVAQFTRKQSCANKKIALTFFHRKTAQNLLFIFRMMFNISDIFLGPNNRITVWLEDKQQSMEVNASAIEVTILTTFVIVILI